MCLYNSRFKTLNPRISVVWGRTWKILPFTFWTLTCPSSLNKTAFPFSMWNQYTFKCCTLNVLTPRYCLVCSSKSSWVSSAKPLGFILLFPRIFFPIKQYDVWRRVPLLCNKRGQRSRVSLKALSRMILQQLCWGWDGGCFQSCKYLIWMTKGSQVFRFLVLSWFYCYTFNKTGFRRQWEGGLIFGIWDLEGLVSYLTSSVKCQNDRQDLKFFLLSKWRRN